MKTINIAGCIDELLIFDDPEYCEDEKHSCHGMSDDGTIMHDIVCGFFFDDTGLNEELKFNGSESKHEKCPQCKEAWKEAKEKGKQKIRLDNHRASIVSEILCTMSPESALHTGQITHEEYESVKG